MPRALDRRFEAVVLIGDSLHSSAATTAAARALLDGGMIVGVIGSATVDEIVNRMEAEHLHHGLLLLAGSSGDALAVAERSIVRRLPEQDGDGDSAAVELAGRLVVEQLSEIGIAATVLATSSVCTSVELNLPSSASEVNEFLLAHGVAGMAALGALLGDVARRARDDVRISLAGTNLTIRLRDDGDALRWVFAELWPRGIGLDGVVVVADAAASLRSVCNQLLASQAARATMACAGPDDGAGPLSSPADIVWLDRLSLGVDDVLVDQLRRRQERDLPAVVPEYGWELSLGGFDAVHERVHEALFGLADGRTGTSGAPVVAHPSTNPWVLVSGVYDGNGPATQLLTGPVGVRLPHQMADDPRLRRVIDLHTGVLREEVLSSRGPIASVRFSSLARPGTVVLRAHCPDPPDHTHLLLPPEDHEVHDRGDTGHGAWMRVAATSGGIAAAAIQQVAANADGHVVDRVVVYEGDQESLPDTASALDPAREASQAGFDRLLGEHRRAWAERWEDADVVIEGDDEMQRATRFTLFQLMGSVADAEEAAVGARGVSGPSYRGHVFWDADTFVLPFFAATHQASARAMLEYRLRRLPAAMETAKAAGRDGARFPWESARSGFDVTPISARDRAGHVVPIRTGRLEEHIVADVAWAACCYTDWTGDDTFARGPGAALLIETARYWASRIRVDSDGTAHLYGVIGPDEYHETVDDNAYTNVMARWNLRRAAHVAETFDALDAHGTRAHAQEVTRWRQLADALIDGYDADTGIYEQFSGFHRLERLIIAEVAPRRPIAADLLLGAERVRGSQVVKQADVLMLHHLVPGETAPDSLEPNLRYYEPRTAHGSSLSPAIHASLFARARDYEHALEALRIATRIDLDDLTGSTAGGLHVATMGGVWQALAFGFAGLRPRGHRLDVDPRLPPAWAALELRVRFHGSRVRVRIERASLSISADPSTPVSVGAGVYEADPRGLELRRRGPAWEVTT